MSSGCDAEKADWTGDCRARARALVLVNVGRGRRGRGQVYAWFILGLCVAVSPSPRALAFLPLSPFPTTADRLPTRFCVRPSGLPTRAVCYATTTPRSSDSATPPPLPSFPTFWPWWYPRTAECTRVVAPSGRAARLDCVVRATATQVSTPSDFSSSTICAEELLAPFRELCENVRLSMTAEMQGAGSSTKVDRMLGRDGRIEGIFGEKTDLIPGKSPGSATDLPSFLPI